MTTQTKYFLARSFMQTVGQLSDGIRLCYKEGLTSGKTLDYIYKNKPSGKLIIGKILDKKFINDPGWEATRIRRKNLEKLLTDSIEAIKSQDRSVSILDIASGPGAYIISVVEKTGKKDVFALCRDFETRWVEEGNKTCMNRNLTNVFFEKGDAFNEDELLCLSPKPNIVVASGFYDWFNDDEKVKESIKIVFNTLESGGYFVLSNQCAHPKLEFTEQVFTDFRKKPLRMTMRPESTMHSFLVKTGFRIERTLTDSNGYYAVIQAKKI